MPPNRWQSRRSDSRWLHCDGTVATDTPTTVEHAVGCPRGGTAGVIGICQMAGLVGHLGLGQLGVCRRICSGHMDRLPLRLRRAVWIVGRGLVSVGVHVIFRGRRGGGGSLDSRQRFSCRVGFVGWHDSKGAWVQQHVDAKAGRMRADALLSNSPPPRQGLLWLVVGAAVNVPWVFRTQGITDAQMLPWALALFAAAVVWVAAAYMGPMLGRAVLLLRLERATKQRLVHEHFEDIQQLRRDFWLSRWLMPAEAALDEPPSKPEKRR
jgi:hypothetical protein